MSNHWHLVNTPPALLPWLLEQPWCLAQSPEGVVTIAMAVHPDLLLWTISATGRNPDGDTNNLWHVDYRFRVDHASNILTFVHATGSRIN